MKEFDPADRPVPHDIAGLIQRLLDADLSADEQRTLMQAVMENKEHCEDFALNLYLHSALQRESTCLSDAQFVRSIEQSSGLVAEGLVGPYQQDQRKGCNSSPPAPVVFDQHFPPGQWPWIVGGALAAFCICAMVLSLIRPTMQLEGFTDERLAGPTSSGQAAAYLTVDNGVVWSGGKPAMRNVGSSVQLGDEIALAEGIAEFRLASGIAISIEGPASLFLVSPSKLVLQYGKLTALVPWSDEGLNVVTPGCHIHATDAEFGICLTGNKLEIHAFSGEVAASGTMVSSRPSDRDDDTSIHDESIFRNAVVAPGRSLQLSSSGEFLQVAGWNQAEPGQFAAKLSMSGPLPITPDYVDLVKSARPIGYWRFERISKQKIPNEVKSGPPLKAIDKSLLVGDESNRVAEFRADGDWFVRTVSRLPLADTDFCLEFWVKPSHLHQGRLVGLDCKDVSRASTSIELQGGIMDSFGKQHLGALRYVHHGEKGGYASCFSSRPYAVRRWQHVAAVKSGSEMKLYLDGILSDSRAARSSLPKDAFLVVGIHHGNRREHKFIGQIDELAIYDRALSAEEIRRHYEAVERVSTVTKEAKEIREAKRSDKTS